MWWRRKAVIIAAAVGLAIITVAAIVMVAVLRPQEPSSPTSSPTSSSAAPPPTPASSAIAMLPSTHLGTQGKVTVDTHGNVYVIDRIPIFSGVGRLLKLAPGSSTPIELPTRCEIKTTDC